MLGWCSGFLLGLCWGPLLICPETLCVSGIHSCWPASPVPSSLSCFTDLHGGLEMGSWWPGSGSMGLLQHCPPVRNMAPSAHRRRRSSSRNWPKNKGHCVSSYRCVVLLPLDPRILPPSCFLVLTRVCLPQVHIQTIGILVSEKSDLYAALTHTQQAVKQKTGEPRHPSCLLSPASGALQLISVLQGNVRTSPRNCTHPGSAWATWSTPSQPWPRSRSWTRR